jgi:hypothetical protein
MSKEYTQRLRLMRVYHPHAMYAFTGEPVFKHPIPLPVNPECPLRSLEYYLAIFGHKDVRMLPISVGTIIAVEDFSVYRGQVGRV